MSLKKIVPLAYDDVLAKLPELLATEGFGVLTQIDVRDTLRQKLGVEHRPYKILGACNPSLAHRALQAELDVGVMLPCNIVVYADGDTSVVIAIDPMETVASASAALLPIAQEVRTKLGRVLDRLPS